MARAAALQAGLPVGPVCAAKAGLVKKPQPKAEPEPGGQADPFTIDLFAQL